MSSINEFPTFQYSQPAEYRFSHDSVFLARRIFEMYADRDLSSWRVLDLCSGCGIIGLDFLFHLRAAGRAVPGAVDFLEVQSVYEPHFLENKVRLGPVSSEISFLNQNYEVLLHEEFKNTYDLILCNPPYFFADQGKLSPSEFKNRCRFFLDSSMENLFKAIANSLKPSGSAFVLAREKKSAEEFLRVQSIEPIRGTPLLHCQKQ